MGPLLQAAPFRAHLEYHTERHNLHLSSAELFIALEGSGENDVGRQAHQSGYQKRGHIGPRG
jgi:hypothetical protein